MEKLDSNERYARQIMLHEFGEDGQTKLKSAHVLVVGVGGLGCPVLQYLVAAGVGKITILDDDIVSLNNLHRQILFDESNIGELKVDVAKQKLSLINSNVLITAISKRLNPALAAELFPTIDLVVDTSDNFATRYLVNDACVLLKKTLVFGAVSKFEGQVAVFNRQINDENYSTNYRDLFPSPPAENILNCEEAGVLGVVPGVIGTIQAMEAIKLITGIGEPLENKLLTYNALRQQFYTIELTPCNQPHSAPKTLDAFLTYDYPVYCQTKRNNPYKIDLHEIADKLSNAILVDIREPHEKPKLNELITNPYFEIPLSELHEKMNSLKSHNVVFICKSGKRSENAVGLLLSSGHSKEIFSIKGGVDALLNQHQ